MATPVKYRNGLIGTIFFHGFLFFLLFLLAFRTPLPLPAEQGILVDFGNSESGSGDFEPRMSDAASVRPQPSAASQSAEEQPLTQDVEETVALPSMPETKPETEKPKEAAPAQPEETTSQPVEQPKPERAPDPRAMFPGRGNQASTATSQGIAGGQGNQGVPTGAADAHVYGPGGDTGGGEGFELKGRRLAGRLPRPNYNTQEEGRVVVEITVDKDGNVIDAVAGVRGTTTLDNHLLDAALKAAKSAKFDRKPDAPVQKGTITYIFKIQGE